MKIMEILVNTKFKNIKWLINAGKKKNSQKKSFRSLKIFKCVINVKQFLKKNILYHANILQYTGYVIQGKLNS